MHSESGVLDVEFSILRQFEPEELVLILGRDGYLAPLYSRCRINDFGASPLTVRSSLLSMFSRRPILEEV